MSATDDPNERTSSSTTLVKLPALTDPTDHGIPADVPASDDIGSVDLLVVAYDSTPEQWIRSLFAGRDERPDNFGFVSVGDRFRSTAAASRSGTRPSIEDESRSRSGAVTPIEDPTDHAEVGLTIHEYLDDWSDTGRQTVVLFDSVTALLQWNGRDAALEFLHVLRHEIIGGASAYFFVHPGTVGVETSSILETTFDDVVEYGSVGAGSSLDVVDPLMETLAHGTRRAILEVLAFQGPVSVSDLVSRLQDRGTDEDASRLAVQLYHSHLPRLADCELIAFDRERETVELATPVERVRPYLRLGRDRSDP